MNSDVPDSFDDPEELEAAVRRAVRDGVSEALRPTGWLVLGVILVLVAQFLFGMVVLDGLLVFPGIVVFLLGLYMIGFAVYALVK